MAESVGVLIVLALALAAAGAVLVLRRQLVVPDDPEAAAAPVSADDDDPRSGPQTRMRVGFLLGALLVLVLQAALVFLVPWALVLRSLGFGGLVALAMFVAPLVVGVVFAASKGAFEW